MTINTNHKGSQQMAKQTVSTLQGNSVLYLQPIREWYVTHGPFASCDPKIVLSGVSHYFMIVVIILAALILNLQSGLS
jgi:hypothetical protein